MKPRDYRIRKGPTVCTFHKEKKQFAQREFIDIMRNGEKVACGLQSLHHRFCWPRRFQVQVIENPKKIA